MTDPLKDKIIPAHDENGNELEPVSVEELVASLNATAIEMGLEPNIVGVPQVDGTVQITSTRNIEIDNLVKMFKQELLDDNVGRENPLSPEDIELAVTAYRNGFMSGSKRVQ